VSAAAPGRKVPVLLNVSMAIPAGATVGVIGPSAAGKSSLARVMVGVWPIAAGAIRLDGSDLSHWNIDELGSHVGYLPQDVELFSGTIAENISRFRAEATEASIIAAAQMAGVHDMIQHLPDGYNTYIGENGQALSGGQRQRIGLARALYGLPALIVLDEPNANLDAQGEQALLTALAALKEAKRTVVLVTHKTNVLSATDFIVVMNGGQIQTAGPRDQVLAAVLNQQNPGNRPKVQAVSA
jgi:ABC-type protease/lipase transport system fused ATPase/permease subunit